MSTARRGDEALRRHRISQSGTSYFLTLCSAQRREGLTHAHLPGFIRAELTAIEADGHWKLRAGVLMPDHLHLLVCLTGQLPLGRCVARLKAKTKPALQAEDLRWQGNFYEHRLCPNESVEDVVRYLFLNPHRENRIANGESYPWFWLGHDEAAWFVAGTDRGRPFPEWLR
jgi:putative transposase